MPPAVTYAVSRRHNHRLRFLHFDRPLHRPFRRILPEINSAPQPVIGVVTRRERIASFKDSFCHGFVAPVVSIDELWSMGYHPLKRMNVKRAGCRAIKPHAGKVGVAGLGRRTLGTDIGGKTGNDRLGRRTIARLSRAIRPYHSCCRHCRLFLLNCEDVPPHHGDSDLRPCRHEL